MSEITAAMIERGSGPDPDEAARRRRNTSKVRAAREKLTSGTEHRDVFDLELLRLFAHSRKAATPAIICLAIAIAATAIYWVNVTFVIIWFAMVCSSMAMCYGFATEFLVVKAGKAPVNVWRNKFVLAETVHGATWAMIILLLLYVEDPSARTFVLFVLLLFAAMTAMIAASIPYAVYGGLMPVLIAIVFCIKPGIGYDKLMMTLLAVGALLYFVMLANRLRATSLDSFIFRAEKDSLIAELEQAKANSDEARRRSEEANLAKSRFLATMSHELRTPLNAILGFSEVMKGELFGAHVAPAYKEYSADIHSSGQHLLALINEILDLSRVEAGRYELREEAVSIPHVVDECIHLLAIRAKNKSITVTDAIDSGLPRIWADERAMRQIVLNLLSNAIKFTPQGGHVMVKAGWTAKGGQYVSIRDSGPGIPENEIATVLSSFGRGSLAQKNAEEGSGLGLPIVKGLVELHGGTFTLNSKVREGTEVVLVLPSERVMDALPALHEGDTARGREVAASPHRQPARAA